MSTTSTGTAGTRSLVVVGAGPAGLRAAEAARRAGFAGEITIIGAERHRPYDRPTLTKGALLARPDPAVLALPVPTSLDDVRWHLGTRVRHADLGQRTVLTDDGATAPWDGLVVATGLRAQQLDLPGPRVGRFTVRGLDDSTRLRAALASVAQQGGHVVVVGAGFVGCEVASAAARLGLHVTVVAPEPVPLQRALGDDLGRAMGRRHQSLGVRFRLGTVPVSYHGGTRRSDRPEDAPDRGDDDVIGSVRTADGEHLPADLVVEAVGSAPVVDLLTGQGADLSDGVLVDGHLRVLTGPAGTPRPDVVACGDIARFAHPLFDDVPRRVEHWTLASDTGKRAGRTIGLHLTGADEDAKPFAPVPTFWSEQCGVRLQSFGLPGLGTADARVLEGDLDSDVVVGYHQDQRLVGVVMIGFEARYRTYRNAITTGGT